MALPGPSQGPAPRGWAYRPTVFRGVFYVLSASLSAIATSTGIVLADVGSYLNSVIASLASAL